MRMLFISVAAAAFSLATPALAKAGEQKSFEYEGSTYTYTVENKGDAKVVKGVAYPQGQRFSLIVRGDRVRGMFNGQEIAFKVDDAKSIATKDSATKVSMR